MVTTIKNVSVLVLDNEQKIANLVKDVLMALSFPEKLIHIATDGYEGLEIMRKRNIDLIITDWELLPNKQYSDLVASTIIRTRWGDFPPTNGANFVDCLRTSSQSPNQFIPVIMLTGPTQSNHIMYARDCGVNEILMKPINAEDLAKRIIAIADQPRDFIVSPNFRGPCRRRKSNALPEGVEDRRKIDMKIFRNTQTG